MTETQAKSGNTGTSANPVDEEAAKGGTPATGRAAVGRATVPADAPAPKFTRAPGMTPPPDKPSEDSEAGERPEAVKVDAPTSTGLVTPAAACRRASAVRRPSGPRGSVTRYAPRVRRSVRPPRAGPAGPG